MGLLDDIKNEQQKNIVTVQAKEAEALRNATKTIPDDLVMSISNNIYESIRKRIMAVTSNLRGFTCDDWIITKGNYRYEIPLFVVDGHGNKTVKIDDKAMSYFHMNDVFPPGNGYIGMGYNWSSPALQCRNIADVRRVFLTAKKKLNEENLNVVFELNKENITFYAIIPCDKNGIIKQQC